MNKAIEPVSGYSSYETFHVAMFLENNRAPYDMAYGMALIAADRDAEELPSPIHWLADELERAVSQHYLRLDAKEEENGTKRGIAYDCDTLEHSLLTAALARVDWDEIAEVFLGIVKEG